MPDRANKHIRKFNQLVAVYEPVGIEPLETVASRDDDTLSSRKSETAALRTAVEELDAAAFFDDERRTEIEETESLPGPAGVADSQRTEMLDRLDAIEAALSEALDRDDLLDTTDEPF